MVAAKVTSRSVDLSDAVKNVFLIIDYLYICYTVCSLVNNDAGLMYHLSWTVTL